MRSMELVVLLIAVSQTPAPAAPAPTGWQFPAAVPRDAITVCSDGCDYTSIQEAVDAAEPGDTILLGPETFYENVEVLDAERLTIRGTGPGVSILDGGMADVALLMMGGSVTLADLTIQHGLGRYHAGGIVAAFGELRLENCVVSENLGSTGGGAIENYGGGMVAYDLSNLTIVESTFRNNTSRQGGTGSGLCILATEALLERTTIADNEGADELSIIYGSEVTLSNTTVDGDSYRTGIFLMAGGSLSLIQSTVSHGGWLGGIAGRGSVTASLSIVSTGSPAGDCGGPDLTFTSLGHNLDGDGSCGLSHPTDVSQQDPMLLRLADYGGPTPTRALHPDSPAIDAGGAACLATDQRGVPRPCDGDFDGLPLCDIGAFEFGVRGSVEIVGALHDLVFQMQGADHDLVAYLQSAFAVLGDADPANDPDAVRALLSFIEEVESRRGFTIREDEADALIEAGWSLVAQLYGGRSS